MGAHLIADLVIHRTFGHIITQPHARVLAVYLRIVNFGAYHWLASHRLGSEKAVFAGPVTSALWDFLDYYSRSLRLLAQNWRVIWYGFEIGGRLFLGVLRLVWHLLLHPRFFVIVYRSHFPKSHTPLFWRQINTWLGSRVRVFFTGLFRLIFL